MSRGATGNAKKTAQPTTQRTAPVSLRRFKLFSKKTRAFLNVLSDLYQADASHKVPRRSGNTQTVLGLVLTEIGLEAYNFYPYFLLGVVGPEKVNSFQDKDEILYKKAADDNFL